MANNILQYFHRYTFHLFDFSLEQRASYKYIHKSVILILTFRISIKNIQDPEHFWHKKQLMSCRIFKRIECVVNGDVKHEQDGNKIIIMQTLRSGARVMAAITPRHTVASS